MVNATQFHYGRAIMSYNPWPNYNAVTTPIIGTQSSIISYSQRPKIFIDPATSQGGSLLLPFFHVDNWIDIPSEDAFSELGRVQLTSFSPLRHAAAGTDDVSLSVFVRAIEVELCVPTAINHVFPGVDFRAQSGKKKKTRKRYNTSHQNVDNRDEYSGEGAISGPASAIANVAGALEKVPFLAPFAFATRIGASAVSGIAKIFGFSRPPILDTPIYVKQAFFSSLATCDTPETVAKLTVDSKQELTVDPRTTGLSGEDELSLSYITGKETFLTDFGWAPTSSQGALLFSAQVAPMLEDQHNSGYYLPTALSFATWPFRNWSGTLIFRFQIVASAFHRGRLQFFYEPSGGSQDTFKAYNTTYNTIIDIGVEDDFELEVAWAADSPYKMTGWSKPGIHFKSNSNDVASDPLFDNGVICCRVLNNLVAPSADADVRINVFVRAGDDFQLCNPTADNIKNFSYYNPTAVPAALGKEVQMKAQMGDAAPASQAVAPAVMDVTENHPEKAPVVKLVGEADIGLSQQKNQIFFGESIATFRTLLRRYSHSKSHGVDRSVVSWTGVEKWTLHSPSKPYQPGSMPGGPDKTFLGSDYNYGTFTLLNYLMPAYGGWRGSMRSKFNFTGYNPSSVIVNRGYNTDGVTPAGFIVSELVDTTTSNSAVAYNGRRQSTFTGATLMPGENMSSMEVEYPFMTGKRFAFARTLSVSALRDHSAYVDNELIIYKPTDAEGPNLESVEEYVSVGEDFNLFFFLNAPPVYTVTDPLPQTVPP